MEKPKENMNGMRKIEVARGVEFVRFLQKRNTKDEVCYAYAQKLHGLTNGELEAVKVAVDQQEYLDDCARDM